MDALNKQKPGMYNFAPVKDQCEKYYYDVNTKTISVFIVFFHPSALNNN